jgi:hypothetical protein
MPLSPAQRTRNLLGAKLRSDPAADVTDLRRELKYETTAEFLRRVGTDPPPFTDEQIAALNLLLRPDTSDG